MMIEKIELLTVKLLITEENYDAKTIFDTDFRKTLRIFAPDFYKKITIFDTDFRKILRIFATENKKNNIDYELFRTIGR